MSNEKISHELTEEAYGQIAQSIRALDSLLPFATTAKRKEMFST
jgi:hypothetical protein